MKNFIMMTIGSILISVEVYFFKIPNGFVTGGLTGIATLLAPITHISAGVLLWILNAALLLLGFGVLGRKNILKTIYCSMLYSTVIYLFERFIPISEPLTTQPLLELMYVMMLTSVGSALMFNSNASTGGTDIAALVLQKITKLDVGKALLIVDFAVVVSSFFVFNIQAGLFSLLGLFTKAFLIDSMIENLNTCKYFVVITNKREEISKYIMNTLNHGVTVNAAVGEFTNEPRAMLHTVCKRTEASKLRSEIKKIDPHAFIIITTSSEIIGRGFRSI